MNKDNIMPRLCKHPEYPYRCFDKFDKDGSDYYYRHKPKGIDEEEWIADLRGLNKNKCVEYGGKVPVEWAKGWERSLQAYEEYKTLTSE